MDFDFIFKLILTASFFAVSIALAVKWLVTSWLDYVQVMTGIHIVTLEAQQERRNREERDDANY
jgi:hypothetical protein